MGSDLYMEQQNYRPRPNLVEWVDDKNIRIRTDSFYWGYRTVYEGVLTPEIETMMAGMGLRLPDKNPIVEYARVASDIRVSGRADDLTPELQADIERKIAKRFKSAVNLLKKDFPNLDIEVV